jgi:glycosyltransferase involved in cell wall biosynthesis
MPGIAFFITDLECGGAEKALVELATRIDRGRFMPVVYLLKPLPEDPAQSLVPKLLDAGIQVHSLEARQEWQTWQIISRLAALLRQQRPALLQTFMFHANMVGRFAAWRAGVKHVVSGIRVAEHALTYRLWAERWTDFLVEHHVCVSESVATFSQIRGGLPQRKMSVIPNGIDRSPYDRAVAADLQQFGIPAERKAITYVGRLDQQKGLDLFLEDAHEWLDQLPDNDLLLVGQGPERESLEKIVRTTGIERRVHFAGWRNDVPEILRASSALVLPSLWEGMPNAVLEAMAAGIPVVARDVEGVRELLGDDSEAQIALAQEPATLGQKLVTLLRNGDLAARCAAANHRRAGEVFDISLVVRSYEELYARLLEL